MLHFKKPNLNHCYMFAIYQWGRKRDLQWIDLENFSRTGGGPPNKRQKLGSSKKNFCQRQQGGKPENDYLFWSIPTVGLLECSIAWNPRRRLWKDGKRDLIVAHFALILVTTQSVAAGCWVELEEYTGKTCLNEQWTFEHRL